MNKGQYDTLTWLRLPWWELKAKSQPWPNLGKGRVKISDSVRLRPETYCRVTAQFIIIKLSAINDDNSTDNFTDKW